MAISRITGAGIATDTLEAGDIAEGAVGHSELNDATGITTDYHKVPTFANDAARNSAISSPANGMIIFNTASAALQQYNGEWSTIIPAPKISSISGFLNEDTDSTITVFGSSFNSASAVKIYDAASGGTQVGSNATTTFNSTTKLTAVFGGSGVPVAGDAVYIEVDNSGVAARFATAITVNADPTATFAGGTGTGFSSPTHLGTYSSTLTDVDSNTKLLLNFDRLGGTDFEDSSNYGGTGYKVTASGNATIKSSPFGDGKSAMYFDGTGDYIRPPDHADFDFGAPSGNTNDFTIEAWINPTTASGWRTIFGSGSWGGSNYDYGWDLSDSSNYLRISLKTTGAEVQFQTAIAIGLNTWSHVALVRYGTLFNIYVNGIADANSMTSSVNVASNTGAPYIGEQGRTNARYIGYIDEVRVSKGIARWTENFDIPTTRYVSDSYTKLLVHSNLSSSLPSTTFTDSGATTHTLTASGDTKHTTLYNGTENSIFLPALTYPASGKTFGSYGVYFDGVGDFLYSTATNVGSGDFTYDMWMYPLTQVASDSDEIFLDTRNSSGANGGFWSFQKATGALRFYTPVSTSVDLVFNDNNLSLNTWTHIALERYNNVIRCYVNGVQDTTTGTTSADLSNAQQWIGINQSESNSHSWKGYIDSFRQSSTARYQGTNFTPPTTLYNGVAGDAVVPTITFTGTATPALAADEDIEYTSVDNTAKADGSRSLTDTDIGLTLTNLTGGDKSKATLAGTLTSAVSTTHSNMPLKLQVRKTLGDAAYANASRVVTFSGSTTTVGLAPAMPVTGTGIPAATTITTVDSSTTITLSANPTGGTLTGQSLIFEDPTRITHLGGSDVLDNTDTMLTLATGADIGHKLFNARRTIGTAAIKSITGFGFAPDFVWIKSRSSGDYHQLFDTLRGATWRMYTNADSASNSVAATLTSFNTDGFHKGNQSNVNTNNAEYINYGWKAGGTPTADNAAGQTPTSGSKMIDGSISVAAYVAAGIYPKKQTVNTVGKFSISEYTGSGSQGTVPHGLGVAPDLAIVKCTSGSGKWVVHHNGNAEGSVNYLDTNSAQDGTGDHIKTSGSDLIHLNNGHARINAGSTTYIMYCWAAVSEVSAFGTYTGASGGNKVTLDFRPRWIMTKSFSNSSGYTSWAIYDAFRSNFGTSGTVTLTTPTEVIYADQEKIEGQRAGATSAPSASLTIYDDGFKFTEPNDETNSHAGWTYMYAAFA